MEMAREMTRNNPLVMQGVRRLVANVVGRGFVLDSDSGDKGIDDVNGYRWAEWSRSPEACDDQQELDFHGLEKLTLQHVIIDGDLCSLPNRDGGIESQEGHRLKTRYPTRPSTGNAGIQIIEQEGTERTEYPFPLGCLRYLLFKIRTTCSAPTWWPPRSRAATRSSAKWMPGPRSCRSPAAGTTARPRRRDRTARRGVRRRQFPGLRRPTRDRPIASAWDR